MDQERARALLLAERDEVLGLLKDAEAAGLQDRQAEVDSEAEDNADAALAFLQARGILTRQMGGYGLPHHLRITIGTGEEMEIVAAALAELMAGA